MLAALAWSCTTEDTIINWELREVKPTLKRHRKGLVEFLGPEVYDGRLPTVWPLPPAKNHAIELTKKM